MPAKNIVIGQKVTTEKAQRAKELRREMTPAERQLWQQLRANRLDNWHFRRQQIIAGFIVDFYCHQAGLVVEVDGPVHHDQPEADAERDTILKAHDLTVLRFTNRQVMNDMPTVLREIRAVLPARPTPSPLPKREGESMNSPLRFGEGPGEGLGRRLMPDRLSLPQLEAYLWGAATILRGLVDAGDYKQYVFPLLFYKRLSDVWDEEYGAALADSGDTDYAREMANERFVIPDGAHWNDVRTIPRDVGQALRSAMRAIEAANPARLDGIFGDAPWTNKERLPDRTLKNLLEHLSAHSLSLANVPEDELGNAYEFLIKKFADDSGHTAQEFYTNRTVVHLMVQLLQPQPGESIYDPTAGTGGMLISALDEVKRGGSEHRTLRLYGQERNHMTASIARMNLVLHGVEDFDIARGDTLERPAFIERDRLRTFDVVLANPPYSIKQWNRDAWQSDPWGRNFLGTPPQGRADYAFFQHILRSMDPQTGRCAILFPHGVLFRKEEAEMRQKLVEADLVECVLGLGPNLFYNSPMEACVIVCRSHKPPERRGRILFIDAVNAVTRERAMSLLKPEHQQRIEAAYRTFQEAGSFLEGKYAGFARAVTQAEIAKQGYSLSIPLYVKRVEHQNGSSDQRPLPELWAEWDQQGRLFWQEMDALVEMLEHLEVQ